MSIENLTRKNIEQFKALAEFDTYAEKERKFLLRDPSLVEQLRASATPIEQIYLSHPDEEFSLRLRKEELDDEVRYTATLKDQGEVDANLLARMEVETPISAEIYERYQATAAYPRLRKERLYLSPDLSVDWIEGYTYPLLELELPAGGKELHPDTLAALSALQGDLEDVTSDPTSLNETIAHTQFQEQYGNETLRPLPELDPHAIVNDMVEYAIATGSPQVVVGLTGMSGSGKSTYAQEIEETLVRSYGEQYRPVRISTDDYHVGKTFLETQYQSPWTNWDDPRVYDTKRLATDLKKLRSGEYIERSQFDFKSQERVTTGIIEPGARFVIVEGIFAGSPDLANVRSLHVEVPTPPATSIGRDVRRLLIDQRPNDSIGSPADRLRYQLETALPTYYEQPKPRRQQFSGCIRRIGSIALEFNQAHAEAVHGQNSLPDLQQ